MPLEGHIQGAAIEETATAAQTVAKCFVTPEALGYNFEAEKREMVSTLKPNRKRQPWSAIDGFRIVSTCVQRARLTALYLERAQVTLLCMSMAQKAKAQALPFQSTQQNTWNLCLRKQL